MPLKPRAPPTAFNVLENDADDFAETKRDDGQIIAAQTQRGHADEQAGHRRHQSAGEQREQKKRYSWRRTPFEPVGGKLF